MPPRLLPTAALLILLAACSGGDSADAPGDGTGPAADTPTRVSAGALAEAERYFAETCATCHGPEGRGDGPLARTLGDVDPRDFSDRDWQAGVEDGYIAEIILRGGKALGKSPLMQANPRLADKPEVIQGLVAKVRSLGGS